MAKKLYYKIGEACKELDIQPYVLRYWETEFPALSPSKSKSGQRVYSREDLELIRSIKKLLYDEGYTIAGAKKKLEKDAESGPRAVAAVEEADEDEPKEEAGDGDEEDEEEEPEPERDAGDEKALKAARAEAARLRKGVERALGEARALLELLDS